MTDKGGKNEQVIAVQAAMLFFSFTYLRIPHLYHAVVIAVTRVRVALVVAAARVGNRAGFHVTTTV